MFGKKKEINQKLLGKNEEEVEKDNSVEPKKDKNKNTQIKNTDNNFIFYGSDNKFTKQLEIYATLKTIKDQNEIHISKNKKLVLVVVDSNSPMKLLSYKICESFGQFPEYQNLEGLDAINLKKMDEEKKFLPTEGNVGDFVRNGDIIYLELISNEIWIKTNINMGNIINKNLKLNLSMDVKVKRESSFKELRYRLLKCGIMCYLNKFSKRENNFHYIISEYTIFTSEHGIIEENKLKTLDEMKIKQLFDFKNNMKIQIKFYPVEFVLFQKLKAIPRPKKEKSNKKKILWDKFKVSRFRDLLYNKKYKKEKEYIFNYIKKLFKEKSILSKCYIYSIDDDINKDIAENAYEETTTRYDKNEDEKDLSCLNINNEIEGGQDNNDIENDPKRNKSIELNRITQLNKSTLLTKAKTENVYNSINASSSFSIENKFTLIVVPPHNQENDENELSFSNKKYSTKNVMFKNKLINKNLNYGNDDDEDEDDSNEKKNFIENKLTSVNNTRKVSFYESPKKTAYGTLDFEILENNELLEDKDDEFIIYKDLKPKAIVKNQKILSNFGNQNKVNLCNDFENYFDKDKFVDFISGLHLMNIQKGVLENCTIPTFRGFKIIQKKKNNLSLHNQRKKKKRMSKNGSSSFYGQAFPVKRFNFEIGVFGLFIFGIFIYLSYLVSDTYY